MSVSAIFGTRLVAPPNPSVTRSGGGMSIPIQIGRSSGSGLLIECSSRPKKKSTAHHIKTRPRKTQPWDIKRTPTVYPPLPPLPPDWTLVIPADASAVDDSAAAAAAPPPPVPST